MRPQKKVDQPQWKEPIICYECEKPKHIKLECPLLKKIKKFKKKVIVFPWNDGDGGKEM